MYRYRYEGAPRHPAQLQMFFSPGGFGGADATKDDASEDIACATSLPFCSKREIVIRASGNEEPWHLSTYGRIVILHISTLSRDCDMARTYIVFQGTRVQAMPVT
jgi:hypothetical protein